jgi:drug/metabolite transporter superfamily protein YnfA
MPSQGEKVLVMELLATEIILTIRQVKNGKVPDPRQYIGSLFIFAILGGMAGVSDSLGRFAAAFGGLVLVATLVNAEAKDGIIGTTGAVLTGNFYGAGPQHNQIIPADLSQAGPTPDPNAQSISDQGTASNGSSATVQSYQQNPSVPLA